MSTIYSILSKFAPRAARTSTAPNSWAVVALWRRVFALKEEEYKETAEILQECLEGVDKSNKNNLNHGHDGRVPITSPFAVEARQDFLRSISLRNSNKSPAPAPRRAAETASPALQRQQQQHGGGSASPLSPLTRQERNAIHERSINEPNLHVDAMYLPQ